MKHYEKSSGGSGVKPLANPMIMSLPSEEIEFIGFEPKDRARDWILGKARSLLNTTDPDARLQASLVAVKGGYEAVLSLSSDVWDLGSKSFAKEAQIAFKNAYKSVRNQFADLKARYLSEIDSEPRPFSLY